MAKKNIYEVKRIKKGNIIVTDDDVGNVLSTKGSKVEYFNGVNVIWVNKRDINEIY